MHHDERTTKGFRPEGMPLFFYAFSLDLNELIFTINGLYFLSNEENF